MRHWELSPVPGLLCRSTSPVMSVMQSLTTGVSVGTYGFCSHKHEHARTCHTASLYARPCLHLDRTRILTADHIKTKHTCLCRDMTYSVTRWPIASYYGMLHVIFLVTPYVTPIHRPQLAKGLMQLYSFEQQKSQPLEAHAASFATVKVSDRTRMQHSCPNTCSRPIQSKQAIQCHSHQISRVFDQEN